MISTLKWPDNRLDADRVFVPLDQRTPKRLLSDVEAANQRCLKSGAEARRAEPVGWP
jgi:hypothetical protein